MYMMYVRDGPIPGFCRYSDMPILAFANTADTADTDTAGSAYRQLFSVADTDTADTEKSADMPIFPIPIPVSAHP